MAPMRKRTLLQRESKRMSLPEDGNGRVSVGAGPLELIHQQSEFSHVMDAMGSRLAVNPNASSQAPVDMPLLHYQSQMSNPHSLSTQEKNGSTQTTNLNLTM